MTIVNLAGTSLLLTLMAGAGATLHAQTLQEPALVDALRRGGYVLVMRHASSPAQLPDARHADPENTARERQLDDTGKATATAMGRAIRRLGIPVAQVLSSPTYRARETARLAELPAPATVPELGDRGKSMQAITPADGRWLAERAQQAPPRGANVLLITHAPNIAAAFPTVGPTQDGEMLVFEPNGQGGASLVGRIPIGDWPNLHR
ncbi:MAG TPA: histidine phosphatase family protein [Vicinamibacterales bacterium]|nr:histidine phosphatase family protein [Vicinamibacterales bacterium]